jgi:hypothetical protein
MPDAATTFHHRVGHSWQAKERLYVVPSQVMAWLLSPCHNPTSALEFVFARLCIPFQSIIKTLHKWWFYQKIPKFFFMSIIVIAHVMPY